MNKKRKAMFNTQYNYTPSSSYSFSSYYSLLRQANEPVTSTCLNFTLIHRFYYTVWRFHITFRWIFTFNNGFN